MKKDQPSLTQTPVQDDDRTRTDSAEVETVRLLAGHVPADEERAAHIPSIIGCGETAVVVDIPLVDGKPDFSSLTFEQHEQYVRDLVAECNDDADKLKSKVATRLYPALLQLEYRYKNERCRNDLKAEGADKDGWYAYLERIGIKPDTFKKWKQRHAAAIKDVEHLCLPPKPNPLTPEQQEVMQALIGQGCPRSEAQQLAKAAQGSTFSERFTSALTIRIGQNRKHEPTEQAINADIKSGSEQDVLPVAEDEEQEHPEPEAAPCETSTVASAHVQLSLATHHAPSNQAAEPANEHEALLRAAERAAMEATNKVGDTDVKARYHAELIFYTHRDHSLKFAKYLKTARGISPEKLSGHTAYTLEYVPFRTYEQAWAYAMTYAATMKHAGMDICYSVVFHGDKDARDADFPNRVLKRVGWHGSGG